MSLKRCQRIGSISARKVYRYRKGACKGVRTFAAQVKHLATDNYDMWSVLTGEPVPSGIIGVEGPPEIKSKADIMKYLRGSFAMGHRAIATLTAENAMELLPFRSNKLARLDLAFWAAHALQRSLWPDGGLPAVGGIVPPASRPR
ncbi:MAG: DinB family protein [Bacteroidota bacterium]